MPHLLVVAEPYQRVVGLRAEPPCGYGRDEGEEGQETGHAPAGRLRGRGHERSRGRGVRQMKSGGSKDRAIGPSGQGTGRPVQTYGDTKPTRRTRAAKRG